MLYVNGEQVAELLDMKSCIALMKETLKSLSAGNTRQKLRIAMDIGGGNVLGVMPAAIDDAKLAGSKVITVFPGNFYKSLPSHQGVVVLFETETGTLKAVVEGEAITGIRTAAVSALATDLLSVKNARVLALLGSGLQARKHVEAICLVRNIEEIKVWDLNTDSAKKFKQDIEREYSIPVKICENSSGAVVQADIICTVTASKTPILFGKDLKKGAHINAVGACSPDARELDSEAVKLSKFYGDCVESTTAESGDFLIPLKEGVIKENHLLGEIGSVALGNLKGRVTDLEITVFESLGLAAEDLAAANYVYKKVAKE